MVLEVAVKALEALDNLDRRLGLQLTHKPWPRTHEGRLILAWGGYSVGFACVVALLWTKQFWLLAPANVTALLALQGMAGLESSLVKIYGGMLTGLIVGTSGGFMLGTVFSYT